MVVIICNHSVQSSCLDTVVLFIHSIFILPFTISSIHIFNIHPAFHPFIYSSIQYSSCLSPFHIFIYSYNYLSCLSPFHLFTYSFIRLFIYSCLHLFYYSSIHLFIYLFIHPFIILFNHPFAKSFVIYSSGIVNCEQILSPFLLLYSRLLYLFIALSFE